MKTSEIRSAAPADEVATKSIYPHTWSHQRSQPVAITSAAHTSAIFAADRLPT